MDSVFAYDTFDNPLQKALDKKSRDFVLPEIDTNLCIFPLGRTDNQEPICNHTRRHLDKMHEKDPEKKFLHIGVGGLFNFDIAAAGGHDAVLLVDINPAHTRYMKKLVQTLASSDSRAQFIGSMYEDAYMKDRISKLMDMKWLRDDKSFSYLHALARNGKIFLAPLDIYDTKQCQKIKEWVDEAGFTPATIYTSNIMEHGLNHAQNPLSEGEIAYMQELSGPQQDKMLYKKSNANTTYQKNLPTNIAGTLRHNLNLLSSEETLSFMAAELPISNVMHPRILIEGKAHTLPSPRER